MSNDFNARIKQLLQQDSRYAEDAYRFISDAVTFTVNRLDEHRHVNAGELIAGIRDFAEHEYGVLARSRLKILERVQRRHTFKTVISTKQVSYRCIKKYVFICSIYH